jgi:hypothetical protein
MHSYNFIDRTNQIFDRLTVKNRAPNNRHGQTRWECQCVCGNIITVNSGNLTSGHVKSCGCLNKEIVAKRSFIHGMSNTPEFQTWARMLGRCNNPNNNKFKDYGKRGIKVCEAWEHDFMAFFKHVGPKPSSKHSIDRIENDGNYKPGNVRWATKSVQANNRRTNHTVEIHKWTLSLAQWAHFVGIPQYVISLRLKRGWPPAKAIFQKVKHKPISP